MPAEENLFVATFRKRSNEFQAISRKAALRHHQLKECEKPELGQMLESWELNP